MLSIIPFWIVALFAVSWVKGQMLTYEIIPIWSALILAILFLPCNSLKDSVLTKRIAYFILPLLIFGLINGSTKMLVNNVFNDTPTSKSMERIDAIIEQALAENTKLDTNFFVYNPRLVSHDSWIYDLNNIRAGTCFLHLPDSDRKLTLEKTRSNLGFETIQYRNSSFFKTCLYLK
jgi:hypothetical protein